MGERQKLYTCHVTARKPLVLVVLGTRPEAIKLAPVARALRAAGGVDCRIVSTAQHREMLDQMLGCFELRPSWDFGLMRPGQTLNGLAARALERLGALIRKQRPALVVVEGDTTTALCGALAAFHEGAAVAHVEAGLRSFDRAAPFPEEANRVLVDQLADLLYAPTPAAARHLKDLRQGRVLVTGNTVVDAVRWAASRPRKTREPMLAAVLSALRADEALILASLHRRESLDGGIESACRGLRRVLEERPQARLVFPVHPNPKVRAAVSRTLRHPRAHLLPPLDYFDAVAALRRCRLVMTDSGGLQEEAASLGKPALVLRDVTDRPEALRAGVAEIAGLEPAKIAARAGRLLSDEAAYRAMARPVDVFGDGRAGERIAHSIRRFLGLSAAWPAPFKPSF